MFKRLLLQSIHADEAIIRIVRVSWFHYRWNILQYSILLISTCFFFYPLQTIGAWGIWIFLFLFLLSIIGFVRLYILWSLNVMLITNKRIIDIDQLHLFEKRVSECPLEHIQDIRYTMKGFFATLLQVGTVIIDSGSVRGHIEFTNIYHPAEVKDVIMWTQKSKNHQPITETE